MTTFERAAEAIAASAGLVDGQLDGIPVRVEVNRDRHELDEEGRVVAARIEIVFHGGARPRAGQMLVVGSESFELDSPHADDGYTVSVFAL